VSKVVRKFEQLRWIEIGRDDTDARNRPVRITTDGMARLAEMQRSFGPVFAELLDGWQQAELERLIVDLARLAEKLNALSAADRKR
jgi:DNA-binding MarR family transcriptional regulator